MGGTYDEVRCPASPIFLGLESRCGVPVAFPIGRCPYEVIHLGGEAAAIVPLADLRRLEAVQRHAPADLLEQAEIEAALAAHREWAAAGRPGAVSREEAMA